MMRIANRLVGSSMSRTSLTFIVALGAMACDGEEEPPPDAGRDTGASTAECSESAPCASGFVCVDGECTESVCGDGIVDTDAGEQCDDENEAAFDGCEPVTCTFTCDEDARCVDAFDCNGIETCSDDHVCVAGTSLGDGAGCTLAEGGAGVCRGGIECVPPGCGNGTVDGAEQCDDENEVDCDGCENDCTFSCEGAVDCDDLNVCNGEETCGADHRCVPGTPLVCDDGIPCTMNLCDGDAGCDFDTLVDGDGDGHASDELGECGTDCDDAEPTAYEGAEELCGDEIDNNCTGGVDEIAPFWYVDCDNDGYAASTDTSVQACDEPPATGCGGGWTTTRPIDTTNTDCHDGNPTVHPGAHRNRFGSEMYYTSAYTTPTGGSSWDYNCNNAQDRQYGCVSSSTPCTSCLTNPGPSGFLCSFTVACGASGTYSTCVSSLCPEPPCTGGCSRISSMNRTQGCR